MESVRNREAEIRQDLLKTVYAERSDQIREKVERMNAFKRNWKEEGERIATQVKNDDETERQSQMKIRQQKLEYRADLEALIRAKNNNP